MKKLFTLACALVLGGAMTLAQTGGTGGAQTPGGDQPKAESHKGGKKATKTKTKKSHKGGKKGTKSTPDGTATKGSGETTPPPK